MNTPPQLNNNDHSSSFTIRKVPSEQDDQQVQKKQPRCCRVCGIKHNAMREFCKIIVICIGETNEAYCDICLAEQLEKECAQVKLLEQRYIYQKQFQTSMSENDKKTYLSFERDPNSDQIRKEADQLEAEQVQLDHILQKLKQQSKQMQTKVYALEKKEQKFWMDLNKFEKRALKLQEKAFLAKNQRQLQKQSLEQLSKTSIIHKFFQIEIEDSYAQVCGLTVGKKPDQVDVNWEQTNAALGHLLLAYNYLSLKYGIPYTRISDMKIQGHLSEIQSRTSQMYYPIAYTGRQNEKTFGIMLQNLLAQLGQLTQHIQEIQNIEYTQQLKLPFQILKKEGKIVDLFINPTKIQDKNRWSQWTKAMRYFLIDIKHILTISLLSDPYL